MKATEFCYWLQGAFELASIGVFDELQLGSIKKHLALVRATDQTDQPREAVELCTWLQGGIEFIRKGDGKTTAAIRVRLASVFEHAIDPTYPNQDELDEIHADSGRPPYIPNRPGMGC